MKGIVAAGDQRSAQAGAAALALGGNAVDAAVAAAFASFVVETCVVNIAGGGYALVAHGAGGDEPRVDAYDFFCAMPSGRPDPKNMDFREIWVDFGGHRQPFNIGRASTGAPGVVAGLCRMAADHGALPLAETLAPAIELAGGGFEITPIAAYVFRLLGPIYRDTAETRRLFAPGGDFLQAGDWLRLPDLARTLEALAREGEGLFYRGAIAEALTRDHRRHGGLILPEDLAGYRAQRVAPLRVRYRDYDAYLPPPSSHGGALVGFALKLLESASIGTMAPNGSEHIRALAHVMRLTQAARRDWDLLPEHDSETTRRFLSDAHAAPYLSALRQSLAGGGAPTPPPQTKRDLGSTSHISAIDAGGMAVSMTTSTGEAAGYLVGDTGVCPNNVLGEHDLNPRGFHKAAPGQRLNSMMSPLILMRGGRPRLAVGSAGSSRIRSAILQTVSNFVDFDMPLDQAVNQPRVHFEDGVLQLEAGIAPETAERLAREAWTHVNPWRERSLFFGGAQAAGLHEGQLEGGADNRRGGGVAAN